MASDESSVSGRLAPTAEEQRDILDSLGLLETTGSPPDGLMTDILNRMDAMGLLKDVREPLDSQGLSDAWPSNRHLGISITLPSLFVAERAEIYSRPNSRFRGNAYFRRARLGQYGVGDHAGCPKGLRKEQTAVEVVSLNEEQPSVRAATSSPMTAVTGPPGTGKSQIVVSMIADAYVRGRRVLFTRRTTRPWMRRSPSFCPGTESNHDKDRQASW